MPGDDLATLRNLLGVTDLQDRLRRVRAHQGEHEHLIVGVLDAVANLRAAVDRLAEALDRATGSPAAPADVDSTEPDRPDS